MKHFICTGGCEGVADKEGVCRTEDCEKKGEPLDVCDCADGKHRGSFDAVPEEEEE